ncbi:MAG: hypothetical protein WC654_01425 [Patescibacteria group bacterium]
MLASVSSFFASIYNLLLFALAIWGAVRFGAFVIGRSWHWVVKAIVILMVTFAIWGYVGYMAGGAKTDLRIVTELCATAGAIFGAEWLFRHVRNGWGRAGIVVVTSVFLAVTWTQTADRLVGIAQAVPSAVVSQPASPVQAPATDTANSGSRKDICDENISFYQREQLNCP